MDRPTIVCLCGSTRFREAYQRAFKREEHRGKICLTVPCYKDDPCCKTGPERIILDVLHMRKVEMADEILVINVGNYIGESTAREIEYAKSLGKPIRFWEQVSGDA